MTNSILISKVIYNILSTDQTLKDQVGNRIFPVIADNNVQFPFITFRKVNIVTGESKDGYNSDNVLFTVVIASDKYFTSVEIANQVRHLIEQKRINTDSMSLYYTKLTGIEETFEDNAYVQQLTFETTVEN